MNKIRPFTTAWIILSLLFTNLTALYPQRQPHTYERPDGSQALLASVQEWRPMRELAVDNCRVLLLGIFIFACGEIYLWSCRRRYSDLIPSLAQEDDLPAEFQEPLVKLVALLLNEATTARAETLRLYVTEERLLAEHYIEGEWRKAESPPRSLWYDLSNLLVSYTGEEYWTQGHKKGLISRPEIQEEWKLETGNLYEAILLHSVRPRQIS